MNSTDRIHMCWKRKCFARLMALKWIQSNCSHSTAWHSPVSWITPAAESCGTAILNSPPASAEVSSPVCRQRRMNRASFLRTDTTGAAEEVHVVLECSCTFFSPAEVQQSELLNHPSQPLASTFRQIKNQEWQNGKFQIRWQKDYRMRCHVKQLISTKQQLLTADGNGS